jgi:hypothetical protein
MKKVLMSVAVLIASFAVFAFDASQSEAQVTQEINDRVARGETLEQVAAAANTANVPVATFLAAFTATGKTLDSAVASAVSGGYVSTAVVDAAVAKGGDRTAMTQTALVSLPATGAGGNTNTGGNTADAITNTGGLGNVGGNRSATVGGASGNVSPS